MRTARVLEVEREAAARGRGVVCRRGWGRWVEVVGERRDERARSVFRMELKHTAVAAIKSLTHARRAVECLPLS